MLLGVLLIIGSIAFCITAGVLITMHEEDMEMNDKRKCRECGIVSRRGYIELFNIGKNPRYHCPQCEKLTIFRDADDEPSPCSPKMSWKQCREVITLRDKSIYDAAVDNQMRSYLQIQQLKLKKMTEENIHETKN